MSHSNIKILRKISKEEVQSRETESLNPTIPQKKIQKPIEKFSEKNITKNHYLNKEGKENFSEGLQKKIENSRKISPKKDFSKKSERSQKFFKNFSLEKNKLLITCQAGLESLVKKDNEKIWLKTFETQDRIIRVEATEKQIYEALIWNRFANRVYLELTSQKCETFDELFDIVSQINWKKILPPGIAIVTEATAIRSSLSHTPSLQSITKKAIVNTLTEWTGTHHLYEDRTGDEAHIQVFLINNISYILLDITGNALHKRGWRTESGEAPLKETLAAAIVAISGWKFHDIFIDPFCGSGTIAIEAALLAHNIAPWIGRHFAIENFKFFNRELFHEVRTEAKNKVFYDKKYQIFASDLNSEVLQKAKNNAMRAGVENDIIFEKSDFFEKNFSEKFTIVTNPPYGIRLENANNEAFYQKFIKIFEKDTISGGFITSYEETEKFLQKKLWKNRKLYNGGIPARFFKKNPL